MPTRKDGLRPSEVARAKRVARQLVDAIGEERRPIVVRSVIVQLKVHRMRPRDFDCPDGADAIAAIISAMPRAQLHATTPPLGKIWELIASRAIQYLGSDAYR